MHDIILPRFGLPAHAALMIYIIIGLSIFSFFATRSLRLVPGKLQSILELAIDTFLGLVEETMGHKGIKYFALVMTFVLYILVSNALGLVPGLVPPTANLNATLGCSLVVFFATHVIGIRENGIKYLKHFVGPIWWMFALMIPIEVIGHMVRPMSLALRLFGNMMGHEQIMDVLMLLMPFAYPLLALATALGIIVIFIQTFVFSLLTMMYFGGALEESH
ncbi:MAG: F0F1 ATP synthase subunit A [Deltaproteobacteria bacterium]|nr:F0F1 ATP synthase subunit A [Deltaproteobacteria bacterium]